MFQPSKRTKELKQSGIRSASARCLEVGGVNLGQGICDLPVPEEIVLPSQQAVAAKNIYSACEGVKVLREVVAEKVAGFNRIPVTSSQVMISHGSTGAFVSAVMTLFDPGDEVILFEPFYGYHKNLLELLGVHVKVVPINLEDYSVDYDALSGMISEQTKGIVVCTPNNPSGKVFSREELITIGEIALKNNLYVLTDEIYEYITYPGHEHFSLASEAKFFDHVVTISGCSKTYNMTGWRLGYASAREEIIQKMSLVQDAFYVCPNTPLQYGVVEAFKMKDSYYQNMNASYLEKRDFVYERLSKIGFAVTKPQGAYYMMADFHKLPFADDKDAVDQMLSKAKVAAVTGSSFFQNPRDGAGCLRFCYALSLDKLTQAMGCLEEAFA